DNRLLHVDLDPFGGNFLRVAADFADQNYCVSVRIIVEELDRVEERSADDRVAADTYACGLADAEASELIHGFIRPSAAAADAADVDLFVNAARHDADFAFARRNDARAIGADQARLLLIHNRGDADHIDHRYAFGDADDQRNFRIGCFQNGVSCIG